MKKIALYVLVAVFLAVFSLTAFAMPGKPMPPIFGQTSTIMNFGGAMKTANITVTSVGVRPKIRMHFIARNQACATNMSVTLNNLSSTMTGTLSFPDDGVWLDFKGPFLLKQAERVLAAQTTGMGVIRLDGNVTYDPSTGLFTGSGTVVQFAGAVDLTGVVQNDGNRAMSKAQIHPAAAKKLVFNNGSSIPFKNGTTVVISSPMVVRFSVPAIQMAKPEMPESMK